MILSPQSLLAALWALVLLVVCLGGPPKGPSAQAVSDQLEFPFEFAAPATPNYPHVRARDDCA